MTRKNAIVTLGSVSIIMGVSAMVALYFYDWKLSVIIFFLMWSKQISDKVEKMEGGGV